jgi:membrane protein
MGIRSVGRLLLEALKGWWNDNVPRLGASLSFYTIFALAPVLLVVIAIAGAAFGEEAVRGRVVGELEELTGRSSAMIIQQLLARAADQEAGVVASVVGGVTFLLTSTGAFLELQAALNQIWGVKAQPTANVISFLRQRFVSFGLVVGIGFLLLVSLAVSTGLSAAEEWMTGRMPESAVAMQAASTLLSFAVITVLFTLLYKVLPDVKLAWRDVWVGGAVTALLFSVGKYLIGLYLGSSAPASSYAAAGSFLVFLLWVYYSSQIVLLGAEFTRVWAERTTGQVESVEHATSDAEAPKPLAE